MNLNPDAIQHLWPVVQIFLGFGAFVGGLWAGFRWLRSQIRETAEQLISPVALEVKENRKDIDRIDRAVEAAHRRIDTWTGSRGSGSWRLREDKGTR
jgi:hypothetical protein